MVGANRPAGDVAEQNPEMEFSNFLFWVVAATAVGSAAMVLFTRSIVHMAFWLLASLAGFAGLYLHLGADFLGFVQVVVYIGGILILFVFGVMLTNRADVPVRPEASWRFLFPGVVAGLAAGCFLIYLLTSVWARTRTSAGEELRMEPTSEQIGALFMSRYILPFEVVSVLLLVAMVGASYLARGREERQGGGET